MSLETLRHLRRNGERPDAVVKVVIGKRHAAIEASPDVVTVLALDQPAFIDWRPLVGLPVVLFVCDGANDLGERVLDCVKAAGCKLLGAVWSDVEVAPEVAKPALQKMWRVLCS